MEIQITESVAKAIKSEGVSEESFIQSARRYIDACREFRLMTVVYYVTKSGTRIGRTLEHSDGVIYNFQLFFALMGIRRNGDFRFCFSGLFDLHYNIIWKLHNMGFIDREECDELCQRTPNII
jgi:hypothetical protein